MKLIIDIDEKWKAKCLWFSSIDALNYLYDIMENGTSIPDNATNGDVIKALFPTADISLNDSCFEGVVNKYGFDMKWWNSPYQKGGR